MLAVISDRKKPVGSGSTVNYYSAEVVSANDYYPFGMQQKERTYYGDTSTVLYAGDGSSYAPSTTPEYVAQYESSLTGNYPYVDSSALLDNNITGGKWSNSQGAWTTYNGQSGRALAISSATPTTTTLTFEYDVTTGYKMSVASFSFYQRASSTGYAQYTMSISGTQVGSGNLFVDAVGQDNPLQWTGDQALTTAMNNLTGHVTVVITLSGGSHGSQGTFRIDNFSLNGYTVPTSYSNSAPNLYIHKYNYRYGFNGQEKDNDINGEGNDYTATFWEYDSRIGRRWNIDPLPKPYESPYSVFSDNPINRTDLMGETDENPQFHKVSKGDTYSSISKKYGVKIEDLKKWNGYKDGSIPTGAELIVGLGGNSNKVSAVGGNSAQSSTKESISETVTGTSDVLHKVYEKTVNILNNNTAGNLSISSTNALIAPLAATTGLSVSENVNSQTWSDVFKIWLFELNKGVENNKIIYGPSAQTTADLKVHEGVAQTRYLLMLRLAHGNTTDLHDSWTFGKDAAYNTVKTLNGLQFVLGSYSINVTTQFDASNNVYKSHFTVSNVSSWSSATRFRKDNDGNGVHDEIIPDKIRGSGIKAGGNLTEEWNWDEYFHF